METINETINYEYYISLEVANLLRQLGFVWEFYYANADVGYDSKELFYTVRYVFHDDDKHNTSYIWEDTEKNIIKHYS